MKNLRKKHPLESSYQRHLKGKLDKIPDSWFVVKEAKSIRGIPDIIGVVRGRFVALEVKRSEQEARENVGRIVLQKYVIEQINKAGGFACFVYPENEEEVLRLLSEL